MMMSQPDMKPDIAGAEPFRPNLSAALCTAMNLLNLGILIVDHECRITFANDYATELLRSVRGVRVPDTLSADRNNGASSFNKRLRDAIADGGQRSDSLLALTGADAQTLIVQIVPYRSTGSGQEGVSGSILFVSDIRTAPDLDLRPAAKLYGLTRAELRLLEAVLRGETVAGYSKTEGVTLNTVKGHLAQLFRKTQTCRQSQLVLRVLGNPVFRLASSLAVSRRTD